MTVSKSHATTIAASLQELLGGSAQEEPSPDPAVKALEAWGLGTPEQRHRAITAVDQALMERGLDAEVVGLRYGTMTLAADAVSAEWLSFERDNLLAVLSAAVPGLVTDLRIRVDPEQV